MDSNWWEGEIECRQIVGWEEDIEGKRVLREWDQILRKIKREVGDGGEKAGAKR